MEQVLAEMLRLIGLAGNSGRLLTRFIERHFSFSNQSAVFEYPVQVASFGRLHLAMVMAYLKCALQNVELVHRLDALGVVITLRPDIKEQKVVFRFDVGQLPFSLKERQARLKALHDAMALSPVEHWVLDDVDLEYAELLLIGELAFNKSLPSFSIFEDMVSGDFSRIGECAHALVCLANELNPAVEAAYGGKHPLALRLMSEADAEALFDRCSKGRANQRMSSVKQPLALAA